MAASTELLVLVILLAIFSGCFLVGFALVVVSLCYKCLRRRLKVEMVTDDDHLASDVALDQAFGPL